MFAEEGIGPTSLVFSSLATDAILGKESRCGCDDDENELKQEEEEDDDEMLVEVSMDDAMEMLGMGLFQYQILMTTGLCLMADSMEVLLLSFLALVLQSSSSTLWWGWNMNSSSNNNEEEDEEGATSDAAAAVRVVTSAVFLGSSLGTVVLGYWGDVGCCGRKPVVAFAASLIGIFGLCTAFTHTLAGLMVCRFWVGFGVGGFSVAFDTLTEFLPPTHRGSTLLQIEYFWSAGTFLVCLLAKLTLGRSSSDTDNNDEEWRWFVGFCSIPCLVASVASIVYVPESPRWLLTQGRSEEALRILRMAASVNGKDGFELFPLGKTRLIPEDHDHHDGNNEEEEDVHDSAHNGDGERTIPTMTTTTTTTTASTTTTTCSGTMLKKKNILCVLLEPQWRLTTILLWSTFAGYTILTYGTILVATFIFSTTQPLEHTSYSSSFDYNAILVSACSEIAGITIVVWTVDRVGRIPSQVVAYVVGGMAALALCVIAAVAAEEQERSRNPTTTGLYNSTDDYSWLSSLSMQQQQQQLLPEGSGRSSFRGWMIVACFVARMSFMSASCVTWVSTAELLTTEIRSTGHAMANAMGRLAGALSPWLVTRDRSYVITGMALWTISMATAFCASRLPETIQTLHPNNTNNNNNAIRIITRRRRNMNDQEQEQQRLSSSCNHLQLGSSGYTAVVIQSAA